MSLTHLILASSNEGKLKEFKALLAPLGWKVEGQQDHDVRDVEETGLSFAENAILKARNASKHTGLPALADDSGLEVEALKGAPGVFSARYAGEGASDEENNAKLLEALKDVPPQERIARYWCVLALIRHAEDPTPILIHASWEGYILNKPQGTGGFGYDPLFLIPEMKKTAAQLTLEEKNRASHRGKASSRLLEMLLMRQIHGFS